MQKSKKDKRKFLAFIQLSMLLAIEIIVCFTPLGTLPAVGPLSATLSHVPVIITAVVLGAKAGSFMGFAFGACSFIYWSFVNPGVFSFIYTPFYSNGVFSGNIFSLLICFVPRILIGLVTALVYKALMRLIKKEIPACIIAGVAGSFINTALVLLGIQLFFGEEYFSLISDGTSTLSYLLMLTVLTNGIPEALIGGAAASAIGLPLKRYSEKLK